MIACWHIGGNEMNPAQQKHFFNRIAKNFGTELKILDLEVYIYVIYQLLRFKFWILALFTFPESGQNRAIYNYRRMQHVFIHHRVKQKEKCRQGSEEKTSTVGYKN